MSSTAEYVARLRAAAGRIRAAAPAFGTERLTEPDPETGERWDRGQVLAHAAELVPYWTAQVELVLAAGGYGAPFGRVKTDQGRIDAIEADRNVDPDELLDRLDDAVAETAALLRRLRPSDLACTGRHERIGPMPVSRIIDELLVSHLEEHAAQLEAAVEPEAEASAEDDADTDTDTDAADGADTAADAGAEEGEAAGDDAGTGEEAASGARAGARPGTGGPATGAAGSA